MLKNIIQLEIKSLKSMIIPTLDASFIPVYL